MKILLIEDEFLLATDLKMILEDEGYEVVEVFDNGKEAFEFYKQNQVDFLICDININGEWDGIETAEKLLSIKKVPLIYLTALSDADTINRAKKTMPSAYISKPFQVLNLRISIELAINNFAKFNHPDTSQPEERSNVFKESFLVVEDYIFIKQNYQFIKIAINDICYFEAEHIHTNVFTKSKKYALRMPLSGVLEKLAQKSFVRIHRSFAVNIIQIESFGEQEITVNASVLPLSRSYKEDFLRFFT